jgi:hypothetical protein
LAWVGHALSSSETSARIDTARNLLLGVLALQADLLTPSRFVEACTAWSARKETPLADLLMERGWLSAEARPRRVPAQPQS